MTIQLEISKFLSWHDNLYDRWDFAGNTRCLTFKQLDIFLQNRIQFSNVFHFKWYGSGPIQWIFYQHCGYWWPGALAFNIPPNPTPHKKKLTLIDLYMTSTVSGKMTMKYWKCKCFLLINSFDECHQYYSANHTSRHIILHLCSTRHKWLILLKILNMMQLCLSWIIGGQRCLPFQSPPLILPDKQD